MKTGKWLLLLSLSLGAVLVLSNSSINGPDHNSVRIAANVETNEPGMASFLNSDLLHRDYNMGTTLLPGKITIKKDGIRKACETPDAVLIYSSDVTYDSLPFYDRDLEYEIKAAGHYCFFVLNKDGELIDITDSIAHAAEEPDHILPKQPKAAPNSFWLL